MLICMYYLKVQWELEIKHIILFLLCFVLSLCISVISSKKKGLKQMIMNGTEARVDSIEVVLLRSNIDNRRTVVLLLSMDQII